MLRGSLQKEDLPETLLQKCFPLGREGLLVRIPCAGKRTD